MFLCLKLMFAFKESPAPSAYPERRKPVEFLEQTSQGKRASITERGAQTRAAGASNWWSEAEQVEAERRRSRAPEPALVELDLVETLERGNKPQYVRGGHGTRT